MKLIFSFISLLFIATTVSAQLNKANGKSIASQISVGIVEGQGGNAFQLSMVNGVRFKQWFTGIGTGLDYYTYRSVPVYLSATRYLSNRSNSFFVQGDAGANFAWVNEQNRWSVNDKFKPGIYYNGILGFASGLNKKNAFTFGVGFSHKFLREEREMPLICLNPPCGTTIDVYKYRLNRLSLKLGWQFHYTK